MDDEIKDLLVNLTEQIALNTEAVEESNRIAREDIAMINGISEEDDGEFDITVVH